MRKKSYSTASGTIAVTFFLVIAVLYLFFEQPDLKRCPRMVTANGVEICTESFGNPADPPVLLIMGATASMLSWEDDFCRRLAEGGRYVIRYDNRDTGQSETYPSGKPGYALADMVKDSVGLLDAYTIEAAHFVGASLGGMIAQNAAIEHPGRVLSLTLLMSSPHGPEDRDLPPMSKKVLDHFKKTGAVDWTNREEVIDFRISTMRVIAGSRHPFDEQEARSLVKREISRARNFASSLTNHGLMASSRWRERLDRISAPTLVIHGTEDPVLPFGHGVALSKEIRGAALLPLAGAGHELHRNDWQTVIQAILEHTVLNRK